ncbi:hypothetical protein, partial [Aneurinibacillus migulanus]|uniref:hypothetical protein n=1 Tax=Aneurinibacillus migulanus TaxID=47500 RepID=UPI001C3FDA5F
KRRGPLFALTRRDRREEGDSCGPLSPGQDNRSGRETKGLVCVPSLQGKDEGTRRRVHLISSDIWIINRCGKIKRYKIKFTINVLCNLKNVALYTGNKCD